MSKELPFLIYCIEQYKEDKGMSGNEVMRLFMERNVIEYIYSFYEALHTTGEKYIIQDIDKFIASAV